jgi:hypothetical protein
MDTDPETLFDKLERLEGRAPHDFFPGACTQRPGRTIHSSARLVAFDLLNAATPTVPERKVCALVDGAASLLVHGGGEESARLCLEVVTTARIAGNVVRVLTDEGGVR